MLTIGCHLSASDGFLAMGRTALDIGANTFQFFTRNPRGSKAKAIDPDDAAALLALLAENGFGPLVAHAPYTINPCSKTERTREFARMTLADDLKRMEYLPGNYYNFHPGSHTEQGMETGIRQIAETLNAILRPEYRTTVLLETMSGKGSEVGGRFEELREIIDRTELGEKVGVCLDTCHVSDAGYDIAGDIDGVLTEFDRVIGLAKLKAVHINDSMNPLGAHKDRHARIGEGYLGEAAFGRIVNHPALRELPFITALPAGAVLAAQGHEALPAAADAQVLVQGIADLVLVYPDHLELLDYKTDRRKAESDFLRAYRAQLNLYAIAIEKRFAPKKVTYKGIYSFALGKLIEA